MAVQARDCGRATFSNFYRLSAERHLNSAISRGSMMSVFGLLSDHRATLCIAEAENDLEVPFVSTGDWGGYLRLRRDVFVFSTTIFRPILRLLLEILTLIIKKVRGYSFSTTLRFRHLTARLL
jgi:hypothetical protein